ncbi:hypothetical protein PENSPDRAFT_655232 [Peniophora sp. CONT]|nr:hypothetical protein PENSPDRAFT_655232 [Peniophora sp. CONT]
MTITVQHDDSALLASPFFQYGFLEPAPHEPVCAEWETLLARALALPLKVTDSSQEASTWRHSIQQLPVLPLPPTNLLALAHSTLTFLAHFYMHSLPLEQMDRSLPSGLAIPLMRVSKTLGVPPVLSYADTVFYNLTPAFFDTYEPPSTSPIPEHPSVPPRLSLLRSTSDSSESASSSVSLLSSPPSSVASDDSKPTLPSLDQVRATFSNLSDEAHFYLTSARIERVGIDALRASHTALSSLSSTSGEGMAKPLRELSVHIRTMACILDGVRDGCEPGVYYDALRPWMRAPDNGPGTGWRLSFASLSLSEREEIESLAQESWVERIDREKKEMVLIPGLAGATAAQSSIIQALDAALGLEHEEGGFLMRMRTYIPKPHREFIQQLGQAGSKLRDHISSALGGEEEREAYNRCVDSLKEMRTVHVRIAALYLVNPAPRTVGRVEKGTGGTAAIPFLKGVRDRTASAVV